MKLLRFPYVALVREATQRSPRVGVRHLPSPAGACPDPARASPCQRHLSQCCCGTMARPPYHYGRGVENPSAGSEPPAMRSHKTTTVCHTFGETQAPNRHQGDAEVCRLATSQPLPRQVFHFVPFPPVRLPNSARSAVKTVTAITLSQLRTQYKWVQMEQIFGKNACLGSPEDSLRRLPCQPIPAVLMVESTRPIRSLRNTHA